MANGQPLRESDLIFSSAASSLKYALGELKRTNLSITNRLHSIKQDAKFVADVAEAYSLPLIANERCGSWYIPPERKSGSAYFKSTDGHFGQWAFSLRRLNLHIFDILYRYHGCIIVDSTRRGKSMPDALSKSVPIWTAVLNGLLFPHDTSSSKLQTPPDVVSPSEHSQIAARLPCFIDAVRTLDFDLNELRAKLSNEPLRVAWIRPSSEPVSRPQDSIYKNLILLCTASSRDSRERASSDYVQGAADDSESWACGLDAATFWSHHERLLSASEDELPDLIASLVSSNRLHGLDKSAIRIKPTSNLYICSTSIVEEVQRDFDLVIVCDVQPLERLDESCRTVHLICTTGKIGSRQLRTELPKLDALTASIRPDTKILVVSESYKDIGIGVCLAVLCKIYDKKGIVRTPDHETQSPVNKTYIKQRLSWIMISVPEATPSRTTLQSVNAYLMG